MTVIVAATHYGNVRADWNDDQCDATHPFACEVPSPASDIACTTAPVGTRLVAACTHDVVYAQARILCASYGGVLVRIDSAVDNDQLLDLLLDVMPGAINQVWLGGTDEQEEGIFRWEDGVRVPAPFSNWGLDQPNDLPPGEHCLAISLQSINGVEPGEWVDRACETELKPFVCDAPDARGLPPPSCSEVEVAERRRLICTSSASWPQADDVCEAQGGTLARVDSAAENTALLAELIDLAAVSVWLGGSDLADEGAWRWSDGQLFEELP